MMMLLQKQKRHVSLTRTRKTLISQQPGALAKLPRGKDEDDASYYGQRRNVFVRAVSCARAEQSDCVGISRAVATNLMQILDDNVVAQRVPQILSSNSNAPLWRMLDKSRTLNPPGLAWIHTGEEILSKGIFDQRKHHESE